MLQRLLFIFLIPLALLAEAPTSASSAAQWIADAYGVKQFGQVTELRYTFNVQLPERKISRQWIWRPQEDKVTLMNKTAPVTYVRGALKEGDDALHKIDGQFVNDQYWLLMPFHLVWDSGTTLELTTEAVELPTGQGKAQRLTVRYPAGVGYTPGDAYDLYFDQDFTLTYWVYHKGGVPEPTRMSSWEDHQRFGPLLLSQNHVGPDGFRVWFTDVSVKTTLQEKAEP